jgi:hypothetical protein
VRKGYSSDVEQLAKELDDLTQVHEPGRKDEQCLRRVEMKLRELVQSSLRLRKPILF